MIKEILPKSTYTESTMVGMKKTEQMKKKNIFVAFFQSNFYEYTARMFFCAERTSGWIPLSVFQTNFN